MENLSINNLLDRYEQSLVNNSSLTTETAFQIYLKLMNEEILEDEEQLYRNHIISALVSSDLHFNTQELFDTLVNELAIISKVQSLPQPLVHLLFNSIENEYLPDVQSENGFLVSLVEIDVKNRETSSGIVPVTFKDLKEVKRYLDSIAVNESVGYILNGYDKEIGTTPLLPSEDIVYELNEMGLNGDLLGDDIPNGADFVMVMVTTNKSQDDLLAIRIFPIFASRAYSAR